MAWLSGSAKMGITLFVFGVICGLVVLSNLDKPEPKRGFYSLAKITRKSEIRI